MRKGGQRKREGERGREREREREREKEREREEKGDRTGLRERARATGRANESQTRAGDSQERNAKGTVARKSLRNNPIGRSSRGTPPFIVGSPSELENGTRGSSWRENRAQISTVADRSKDRREAPRTRLLAEGREVGRRRRIQLS